MFSQNVLSKFFLTSFVRQTDVFVEVGLHVRKPGVDRPDDVRRVLELGHQVVDGLQLRRVVQLRHVDGHLVWYQCIIELQFQLQISVCL